ncbi:unnamed protein product [Ranitomeya imitator]|uniref:Uncharacterized protein n=1 Tax=Ranitomeya imitator TaxID=111125 RepID=A0ABN9LPW7_9NEOB|nr:unnamed protein product [Ranitomeya imitator]
MGLCDFKCQGRNSVSVCTWSQWLDPHRSVSKRVNCMAVGGSYLFIGLSGGLEVYTLADHDWISGWEANKVEVCTLTVCPVQDQVYFLGTVDDMGIARLFYFSDENLSFLKTFNEPEDASKRTNCVMFQLSQGGGYAGILLEGGHSRQHIPQHFTIKRGHVQTINSVQVKTI